MVTELISRGKLIEGSIQALRRVEMAVTNYSRRVEHRFDLTGPQIWTLWEMGLSGPQNLKGLAARMGMDPSTLVGVIDRLAAKGLVVRSKDSEDRRQISLFPSAQGWQLLAEAPPPSQGYLLHGLEQMEGREVRNLHRALMRLVDLLEAGQPGSPVAWRTPEGRPGE